MADGNGGGGVPVTLLVQQGAATPTVQAPAPTPHHLSYTGFDLVTALLLAALLVVAGALLLVTGYRPASFRRT
jgi:hypothetical protein